MNTDYSNIASFDNRVAVVNVDDKRKKVSDDWNIRCSASS